MSRQNRRFGELVWQGIRSRRLSCHEPAPVRIRLLGALTALSETEVHRGFLGDFWSGLTRPSLLAVAVCLLVAAIGVVIFLIFAPLVLRTEGYRFLMSSDEDNQTLVSHQILNGLPQDRAAVLPLGTSLMVACVDPWNDLDNFIENATGQPVHVAEYATSAQTSWEMAAILDRSRPPEGSLVILGLSYGLMGVPVEGPGGSTLSTQAKNPKMAFVSEAFDAEVEFAKLDAPARTGVFGLDNAAYFLSRRKEFIKNLLRGGIDYADPLDAPWYAIVGTPESWAEEKASLPNLNRRYETSAAVHFDVLSRMIEREAARGIEFVIAEAPINRDWWQAEGGPAFIQRFQDDIRAFAAERELPFVALNDRAALQTHDFVDMEGHVKTPQARARCTEAVGQIAIDHFGGAS